ncbi:MAG: type IV pilus twitching motility protein PilT [Candidatus Omnitrophica bacterium]|nr:type IV pilus twitching motility protein PilT [Candidatus Omnitrophota bacterium]MCA9425921.1 type IV pilus twitching motility protein PilT [Candidatus Omnitrophota bacterium]MCA9435088.1 type IV pilus twitching motility protein PilT [Candidatus Omnitrophota bacterium]MCA9440814.1 type IV pilus twitching motility protein PilT [Candidatus Omnitrophota bacterium]MCB9769495.1 type IV pilus twitching motility protein PilT [Candidatus Omnitrophota bacterium]
MELVDLLKGMLAQGASDLHLAVGRPPTLRVDGDLVDTDYPPLNPEEARRLVYSVLTDGQKARFERDKELDFSLAVTNLSRFRVNVHSQRGTVAMAVRAIPYEIRTIEELRLPSVVKDLCTKPRGLIVVTGPTGSGKSTSLAAMVDLINRTRKCHIITIEDPIEYIHEHRLALVEQRELESDTHSFASALKYAMRQDPDVILVGEMRDLETIQSAITAAETGHLVLATLHTNDASQTVDRMIDVFPPHQQQQIRIQLAAVLEAVIAQQLLPTSTGKGRVAAIEILIGTPAINALIREGKTQQIIPMMEAGQKYGMQTLNRCLLELYRKRIVTYDTAMRRSQNREDLARMIEQMQAAAGQQQKARA